jgi:hypothetical protein
VGRCQQQAKNHSLSNVRPTLPIDIALEVENTKSVGNIAKHICRQVANPHSPDPFSESSYAIVVWGRVADCERGRRVPCWTGA